MNSEVFMFMKFFHVFGLVKKNLICDGILTRYGILLSWIHLTTADF